MKRMIVGWLAWASAVSAQTVPQNHIPTTVVLEMRTLEYKFDAALASDCAPEFCASKGCSYINHVSVDLPRTGSLPGLGSADGPGSVPPQEYLTEARCQFTYEKSVAARDVRALANRLQRHLSRAWLKVSVSGETLEPIPQALRESPEPPPPPSPPEPTPEEEKAPPPPASWDAGVALRELWVSLLPHFSWMIALVMLTLATLMFIWGARRLGRESIEEKMLSAQLGAGEPEQRPHDDAAASAGPTAPATALVEDPAFVGAQEHLWNDRFTQAESARDESAVIQLLRQWLRAGEYELLAKAVFVFGDKLSPAFASDPELAVNKVEFADYLRDVDDKTLLSRTEFFRRLNHHAVSSHLLAQDDVQIYRSLREEFGATGVSRLMEGLAPRHGALLFALLPADCQYDVAPMMAPELRIAVAEELLASTRISREETLYLFDVLRAARGGQRLLEAPQPEKIVDRGRELDGAGALSVLLPHIEPGQRSALFARAIVRSRGTAPRWYEDILYGDMLLKIPDELRKDVLLEVDVRALAGWFSLQDAGWQQSFIELLAPSMQAAMRANMTFASRQEQLRQARRGHVELVAAVKKQTARGRLSFHRMVA